VDTEETSLSNETKNPEKLYQSEYIGSGTFIISKPKRNKRKMRQLKLKSPNAGMRK
jgi:hypothetical protein